MTTSLLYCDEQADQILRVIKDEYLIEMTKDDLSRYLKLLYGLTISPIDGFGTYTMKMNCAVHSDGSLVGRSMLDALIGWVCGDIEKTAELIIELSCNDTVAALDLLG